MHKTRLFAALLALCALLSGFAALPRQQPGRLYYSWHAVMTCHGGGARLVRLQNTLKLYLGDLGSDGGSRADGYVTFHPWLPAEGFYEVELQYVSGARDRYLEVSVNGDVTDVPCPGDDWNALDSTRVLLPMKKGFNTLRFGNAAWFAAGLYKIRITGGGSGDLPETNRKERDMREFTRGGVTLALDMANGTWDLSQDDRALLRNAFAAADFEGARLYTQEYDTHVITDEGGEITFSHTKAGLPDLVQRFQLREDGLLARLSMESDETIVTNWISPLYTADIESLAGGTQLLQVPFDNDDYATFKRVSVNSVGESHEMTALLNPGTGDAVVIGSVTHDLWKTGLAWRGVGGKAHRFCAYGGAADAHTRDTRPHGSVTGESVVSPTIFIGAFKDWQSGLDTYGKANADIAPPLPWNGGPILGWSSWGVVQDSLTKEIAFAASDYYKEHFTQWQAGPLYINLDAWWNEALGREVAGLRSFVEHCESNGQRAGVYHTPFACWSWQLENRMVEDADGNAYPMEELLLHDEDGHLLPTWDSAYPFDVTHPAAIAWIEHDIQIFIDAGFSYIKLDFMSHGAMEGVRFDKSVHTGIQAYSQAMARIQAQLETAGRDIFVNLSIAPIFPHQYAHGRRIACDTFYSIGNTEYMLNSLTFGFWQRQLYACPDPDHIVVWGKQGQAGVSEARARVTSGIVMNSFLAGDNFADVSPEAQARYDLLLKNPDIMALAGNEKTFAPAHIPSSGDTANAYVLQDNGKTYIAVFNFEPTTLSLPLDLRALAGPGPWQVRELWSGEAIPVGEDGFTAVVNGHDAVVYEIG